MTAHFRCSRGCPGELPIFKVAYRCPKCAGLLDVVHDLAPLSAKTGAEWKETFDLRVRSRQWPYASGVWGKKEWVLPEIRDENVVSLFEGHSHLLPVERLGRELGVPALWVKLCGNAHTGSFKDLGMTVLVSAVREMRARGENIRAIACASTGDTSAALAAYGAYADIPTVVFLPRGKVTTAQLVQPLAHGARVLEIDTDFDGCMRAVKEVCETPGSDIYLANSMNPLRIEGQKTVAIELTEQLDWTPPDWVIIPGGNLGNVSALAAGFEMMESLGLIDRRPRLCVAQAAHANPLFRAFRDGYETYQPIVAQETAASAIRIGAPVSIDRAIRALRHFNGVVEEATEAELHEAAARADRVGLFNCPHTGVALAALHKLAKKGVIRRDDKVVVVSTAHGLKFSEFKTRYHDGTFEHSNHPIQVPLDTNAIRKALDRS